jgi:hypothetical protein
VWNSFILTAWPTEPELFIFQPLAGYICQPLGYLTELLVRGRPRRVGKPTEGSKLGIIVQMETSVERFELR